MKTSEASPRLYHYTTEQGLYGILKEQCLWATHYKFLNDYSEVVLFRDKLIEFLFPSTFQYFNGLLQINPDAQGSITALGGLDALVKNHIEKIVDICYESLGHEIYISSFCAEHSNPFINENGLLSQWRAYGGDGGFAIVFNNQDLQELLSIEQDHLHYDNLLLADVVYSDDMKKYESELSEHLQKFSNFQGGIYGQILQGRDDESGTNEALSSFFSCITRYKHCGFKEEQEVRIVAMPSDDKFSKSKSEKERKFRVRNGQQTPYIELFRSLSTPLPIEKIIVGPHKDKETRAAALRVMLRNTDIKVTTSETPYQ